MDAPGCLIDASSGDPEEDHCGDETSWAPGIHQQESGRESQDRDQFGQGLQVGRRERPGSRGGVGGEGGLRVFQVGADPHQRWGSVVRSEANPGIGWEDGGRRRSGNGETQNLGPQLPPPPPAPSSPPPLFPLLPPGPSSPPPVLMQGPGAPSSTVAHGPIATSRCSPTASPSICAPKVG